MDKIFENAKFGDRYLTREGGRALFLRFYGNPVEAAILHLEDYGQLVVGLDGRYNPMDEDLRDITRRCTCNDTASWDTEG